MRPNGPWCGHSVRSARRPSNRVRAYVGAIKFTHAEFARTLKRTGSRVRSSIRVRFRRALERPVGADDKVPDAHVLASAMFTWRLTRRLLTAVRASRCVCTYRQALIVLQTFERHVRADDQATSPRVRSTVQVQRRYGRAHVKLTRMFKREVQAGIPVSIQHVHSSVKSARTFKRQVRADDQATSSRVRSGIRASSSGVRTNTVGHTR